MPSASVVFRSALLLVALGLAVSALGEEHESSPADIVDEIKNNNDDNGGKNRRGPTVLVEGKAVAVDGAGSPFEKRYAVIPSDTNRREDTDCGSAIGGTSHSCDDSSLSSTSNGQSKMAYYILNEDKSMLYIPGFLNDNECEAMISLCLVPGRFVRSPVRSNFQPDVDTACPHNNADGVCHQPADIVEDSSVRTSDSCVLVPAAAYRANERYLEMIRQVPLSPQLLAVKKEVDFSWTIAERASSILGTDPSSVEPLQVVRYATPDAQYKLHHDHGGFYGKNTEHRPWTMLVFLNDVAEGGHTSFPKLDLAVVPRKGDALAWLNVVRDSRSIAPSEEVDPDMVHAGLPPGRHGIEKYAVNVWFTHGSSSDKLSGGNWS